MHKSYLLRFVVLTLLCFMSVGFRTFGARWDISPEKPTLWLKFCDTKLEFGGMKFPPGDPLANSTKSDFKTVIQSVLDDYNNIPNSYLRVALYPDDPDNPPPPRDGDTVFTKDLASKRTIEACIAGVGGSSGAAAGVAQLSSSGGTITGCTIKLGKDQKDNAVEFIGVFTHEFGHCVGLDHPQETVHAVMSYYAKQLRLMDDDKMGVAYLYPDPVVYGGQKYAETYSGGFTCVPR